MNNPIDRSNIQDGSKHRACKIMTELCNICFGSYEDSTEIILCRHCLNGYHLSHLASWFYFRDYSCPVCRKGFDQQIVNQLVPTSQEELEKLEKVEFIFSEGKNQYERSTLSKIKWGFLVVLIGLLYFIALLILFIFYNSIWNPESSRAKITISFLICCLIWAISIRKLDNWIYQR